MAKIKRNDQVIVIAGKDKGKKGRVLRVIADKDRVLVEGVGMIKKHMKPNPQKNGAGGILEQEAPIHISNVMLVDAEGKGTRIGYRLETVERPDGRTKTNRIRVSRKTGRDI